MSQGLSLQKIRENSTTNFDKQTNRQTLNNHLVMSTAHGNHVGNKKERNTELQRANSHLSLTMLSDSYYLLVQHRTENKNSHDISSANCSRK